MGKINFGFDAGKKLKREAYRTISNCCECGGKQQKKIITVNSHKCCTLRTHAINKEFYLIAVTNKMDLVWPL